MAVCSQLKILVHNQH